jgi:hypothetical protein
MRLIKFYQRKPNLCDATPFTLLLELQDEVENVEKIEAFLIQEKQRSNTCRNYTYFGKLFTC